VAEAAGTDWRDHAWFLLRASHEQEIAGHAYEPDHGLVDRSKELGSQLGTHLTVAPRLASTVGHGFILQALRTDPLGSIEISSAWIS
jgi:hypothetical protein